MNKYCINIADINIYEDIILKVCPLFQGTQSYSYPLSDRFQLCAPATMDVVVQGADVAGLRSTSGQNEGSQIAGWFFMENPWTSENEMDLGVTPIAGNLYQIISNDIKCT